MKAYVNIIKTYITPIKAYNNYYEIYENWPPGRWILYLLISNSDSTQNFTP